ncbi:MAG: MFS transporter [Nitrospinota bacterium]|nr:MFS transporter [Nitrospinota bacterium]
MAGFTSLEKKSIAGLSGVIALRMLGLSMIIPVFSIYALQLPHSSALLAGLAFGVYGFTQAMLQIPFGYYSDRIGRKKVVAFGLILFGFGSAICALTDNIYVLIAGRMLQGGGAIASACFAWVADLTEPSHRSTAMAFLGISVGGSIVMGMIFGPIISGATGIRFLFWLAVLFCFGALIVTLFLVPEKKKADNHETEFNTLDPRVIIKHAAKPDLLRLNMTGFMVNMAMIATFFVVPLRLAERFETSQLWKIYLPLSIMGAVAMMLTAKKADAGGARGVIAGSLISLCVAYLILGLGTTLPYTLAGFSIFFTAFSVLEAVLPSAVSKLADPTHKGSIIGVYNFSQFMGTFVGGVSAGLLVSRHESTVFLFLFVMMIVTAVVIRGGGTLSVPVKESPN